MSSTRGEILFIGDNPSFRSLITHAFAAAGSQVTNCSSREAQVLLSLRAFDLLILNWVDEPGRDAEVYGELCRLAAGTPAYLFVGLSASQTAQQAISFIGKERILPLTVASLMAFGKPDGPPQ